MSSQLDHAVQLIKEDPSTNPRSIHATTGIDLIKSKIVHHVLTNAKTNIAVRDLVQNDKSVWGLLKKNKLPGSWGKHFGIVKELESLELIGDGNTPDYKKSRRKHADKTTTTNVECDGMYQHYNIETEDPKVIKDLVLATISAAEKTDKDSIVSSLSKLLDIFKNNTKPANLITDTNGNRVVIMEKV